MPQQSVLATATTDTNGNYSVSVPSGRNLFIRARAEMVKTDAAPTWNFSVRNNTTAGTNDALYALDGNRSQQRHCGQHSQLRAATGFGTTSYTGTRAAAPFAILDTAYRAKELVLSAAPSTEFPELRMFWSDQNRATANRFCPDTGDIGTTSYQVFGTSDRDSCNQTNSDGIYILGDFANGGRYGRVRSVGDRARVRSLRRGQIRPLRFHRRPARQRPAARPARGVRRRLGRRLFRHGPRQLGLSRFAAGRVGRLLLRSRSGRRRQRMGTEGWFSEFSVGEILWDLFDPANEPATPWRSVSRRSSRR
jgi:hypothetical protein